MDLRKELRKIDCGRVNYILEMLDIKPECGKCYFFMPNITDPRQGYKCKVPGECIAATLSKDLLIHIWKKLGLIDEEPYVPTIEELDVLRAEVEDLQKEKDVYKNTLLKIANSVCTESFFVKEARKALVTVAQGEHKDEIE